MSDVRELLDALRAAVKHGYLWRQQIALYNLLLATHQPSELRRVELYACNFRIGKHQQILLDIQGETWSVNDSSGAFTRLGDSGADLESIEWRHDVIHEVEYQVKHALSRCPVNHMWELRTCISDLAELVTKEGEAAQAELVKIMSNPEGKAP
jgi:hypothetical protein